MQRGNRMQERRREVAEALRRQEQDRARIAELEEARREEADSAARREAERRSEARGPGMRDEGEGVIVRLSA